MTPAEKVTWTGNTDRGMEGRQRDLDKWTMEGAKASLGQHQKHYTNLHVRGKLGYGEGPTYE